MLIFIRTQRYGIGYPSYFLIFLRLLQDNFIQNDSHPRTPSPPPRPSGRPNRRIRLPQRFRDDLPPQIIILPIQSEEPSEDETTLQPLEPSNSEPSNFFSTETNSFGVYRRYTHGLPSIVPYENLSLSSLSDSVSIAQDPADSRSKSSWWSSFGSSCLAVIENATDNYFSPFLNASTFLLMSWFYNGSSLKSFSDIDKLIHDVIRHEDFKPSDFSSTFSTAREAERMDKEQSTSV